MSSKDKDYAMSFESIVSIFKQEGFTFSNEELVEFKKAFDSKLTLKQINEMEDEAIEKILAS